MLDFVMNKCFFPIMRHFNLGVASAAAELTKSYEEAVRMLNTLQSNAMVLEKLREDREKKQHLQLPETIKMADRAGVTLKDIDSLAIIHVSGTKGKGSTCAFCESILRSHGYKTGFFSSPHLVEVRERIRINGRPLSMDSFSQYFWDCFNKLENTKEAHGGTMPAYFRFLTIMAFHVFLQEKVDVAIIEVGIGGHFDSTNIIRWPVVTGVSSLGMDHMRILGDTLDKIAWNKAGIFKPTVPAVTVPQPEGSIEVLKNQAREIGCPLYLAPPLHTHNWCERAIQLGIPGEMQGRNASLAMQLCRIWIMNHSKSIEERKQLYADYVNPSLESALPAISDAPSFTVSEQMHSGLKSCRWPGRSHTVYRTGVTYYIDGAHTPRSIQACVTWFQAASQAEIAVTKGRVAKILLFNATGDRKPCTLLQHLVPSDFDYAAFCPNIVNSSTGIADQANYMVSLNSQLGRCTINKNAWLQLLSQRPATESCTEPSGESEQQASKRPRHEDLAEVSCKAESNAARAFTFSSIQEALKWTSQFTDNQETDTSLTAGSDSLRTYDHIQVLCVGSLHLVGGILGLLEPNINDC